MRIAQGEVRLIALITMFLIAGGVSELFAQNAPAEPREWKGFYLSVQAVSCTALEFPSSYYTYQSIGGAAVPSGMYLGTTGKFSSRPGFGFTAGYGFRLKGLAWGAEIEYARAAAADGPELLSDDVYYGATYSHVTTERTFTQSGRKLSLLDISLFFGVFPFRSFDLGFNLTAGGGYGRQSFTSPATVDAARRVDINTLRSIDWYDFGDNDGSGTWSRGSFIYFIGLGAEYNLSRKLSLRLDYKRVVSSYTRENVLISSGVVNVYQESKDYEYAVCNKFTIGLNYRI